MNILNHLLLSVGLFLTTAANADSKHCKTFLLTVKVSSYDIAMSQVCPLNELESYVVMSVSHSGATVSVDSATSSSEVIDIKRAILMRAISGISKNDADIIVNKVGPLLDLGDLVSAKSALLELLLN
jgi:hypothetical protein